MKKILTISLSLCLILTGCGASNSYENATASSDSADYGYTAGINSAKSQSASYSDGDYMAAESAEEAYYDDADYYDDTAYTDYADAGTTSDSALSDAENKKTSAEDKGVINTEMLVYTCNVSIRTEKFDESYEKLKNLISDMSGFIESENYSENDSAYSSSKNANLTVRVPSKNYNTFLDAFGDIGTVVNKSSNAENVSQEYSDTEKALEIYEAEEERYIERIKTIKDESTLLELESKITELQIKIAQLKSRRSQIETDVAYSYVYINLSESIYKEETEESFGGRFLNVINRSLHGFLDLCEGLLFFIILVLPEVIVILIIIFVIIKLIKRSKRKKLEKREKKAQKEANKLNNSDTKASTEQTTAGSESNAQNAENNVSTGSDSTIDKQV